NSLPLTIFFVSNTINTLNSICLIGIGGQYSYLVFISVMYLYPLYLTYLARQSQVQLQRIITYYKKIHDHPRSLPRRSTREQQQYPLLSIKQQQPLIRANPQNFSRSRAIKLNEFVLYEKQLQIRLYTICTVDY